MKLSKNTLTILKNFSQINNSIFVDEPTVLKTMNNSGSIIGVYDTEEEFSNFAIYDLTELLNIISLFNLDDLQFAFKEDYLVMKAGKNKVRYLYTEADLIPYSEKIKPSEKYKAFDKFNGNFDLSSKEIDQLQKASSIMNLKEMKITMEDGKGEITLVDEDNPLTNKFNMAIEGNGDVDIKVDVSNFQIISGDYSIFVSNNLLLKFEHKDFPLMYFVSAMVSK